MQSKHGFFGALVVVLGLSLGGCGAADRSADGTGAPVGAAGAAGVEEFRRADLVGTWRSSPGPGWRGYSDWLELRDDGTATFTRRRDDTARARPWLASYLCEWSANGSGAAATWRAR